MRAEIKTLQDMLDDENYQVYESETLLNPQHHMINNTDVDVDNMLECNESGCFGVSHGDFIECWRDYLNTLSLDDKAFDSIEAEINTCEQWHTNNKSIDTII